MKRILLYIIIMMTVSTAVQGQLREPNRGSSLSGIGDDLGNNMTEEDRNRQLGDTTTTEVTDVPVDLFQWTLSPRFGNICMADDVDTLWHHYQNAHLTEGFTGQYNHLGNFGSPRQSRIFFDRDEHSQRFFTDVYGHFYIRPDQFRFTNTKSPFTNLTYYSAGNKLTGDDHFKAYFAVNANKRLGFGFLADYMYGRGQYNSQSTAYFDASLYGYYHGERYQINFLGSRYHMKLAENGGITDDRYITDPLAMAEGERTYAPENIPTRMDQTWNRNENWNGFLTQRFNLGFYREKELAPDDTASTPDVEFVPVTSFIHTAEVSTNERTFYAYNEPKGFYLHNFMPNDEMDRTRFLSVKNTLAIALQEGFNKWAQAGLTAFITHEYRKFTLPDTLAGAQPGAPIEYNRKYEENVVSVGGQLIRTQGRTLHYNVTGETVIIGEDLGQFSIDGKGDLNFRLFKDTVRLDVRAYIKNTNPAFYFRHYHSQHYWWDHDELSKEFRTRIEGGLTIDHTRTRLRAGIENIKNYTYFADASQPVAASTSKAPTTYANNIRAAQCGDNIQVFTARLNQDFKLGIFHLDNEVVYQKSSNNTVLPLPDLSTYHNFYITFRLAKVLRMEFGADMRFFTKYEAADYSPGLGQFVQQNQNDKVEIGGYPFVNVYINAHLKRTRFYVMMYHVNQGLGDSNYFLAPHYPANPRTLQLVLSWKFFD